MALQPDWTAANTPQMVERGALIRRGIPGWLRTQLLRLPGAMPGNVVDPAVEGRDGTGLKTEIPWVRVYSRSRSTSATDGWYIVYLFDATGRRVYLSLNQGTTRWAGGEFRPRPVAEIRARVDWARAALASDLARIPELLDSINLAGRTPLGRGYECGNVAAFVYESRELPDESRLRRDLETMLRLLGRLYAGADLASDLPGEMAPEIKDTLDAVEELAGRRPRRRGTRLVADERRAIELRAVLVATEWLIAEGFKVKDVGAFQPYDLDARRPDERLYVEVKGTTSMGDEVILTKGEVDLHRRHYPHTMIILVHGIMLDRSTTPPMASDGKLKVIRPWEISDKALTPIAYRYVMPDLAPSSLQNGLSTNANVPKTRSEALNDIGNDATFKMGGVGGDPK